MTAVPRRLSFASQLVVFWLLVAIMCAVLIGLVWFMAQANLGRQIGLARQQGLAGCETIGSRYDLSIDRTPQAAAEPRAGQAAPQPAVTPAVPPAMSNTDLMHAILDIVLAQMDGMEGGFWRPDGTPRGSFEAYAFPTYQGSGLKRDIPDAETPLILRTLRAASTSRAAASDFVEGQQDAVIVTACPVPHRDGLLAWTLSRVHPPLGPSGKILVTTLAVLLAVIVGIAIALGVLLRRWRANLARIEAGLSRPADLFTPIAPTGEPDLDKIVHAFNAYGARATSLQQQAGELHAQLAAAERFSAIGRFSAQMAHEIRNPIGAMRLKAENALNGDVERKQRALGAILEQIQRVERQLSGLLALTQPVRVEAHRVELRGWLTDRVEWHHDAAARAGIALTLDCADGLPAQACFDADQLARATDNLLLNALRHAPPGGQVTLRATRAAEALRIEVADDGPGVPPAERERIFEPFVTGHAAGSGLGLAVVREIAAAHGGSAFYEARERGACFVIEIPWRTS
ncbi:sensor histidine kinase [Paraburkholderia aromaticivorans]|uniref:histidine kinase n=1 Tax=Paraburkholderia aromaticivorans TaxID=2026199 RepID=A0A248VRT9_9BURK|nr:HAMP domain-containing sensor histidine kinase [Paraburkholderia aromaticivorans]ASW01565.1 two-component sensor histidine kinase [Paraburkholderia aromaticivorans]